MKVVSILNKNNDYQRFEVLKHNRNKRYKYNQFIVEGVRSLNEAVKNNWKIISFIYDKNNLSGWAKHMIETVKTEVNYTLTAQLLKELSGKEETSELLAIIEMREDRLENVALSSNPFIVLFDRPSNKGNLGTMIRSCVKKDKYDIAMISPDPENKAQQCLMKKCGFQYIKTVNVPYANSKSKESVYIKKLEKE